MKISYDDLRAAIVHPATTVGSYVTPEGTLMVKYCLPGDFILWLLYNDHSDRDIDGTMRGILNIRNFHKNGTLLNIDVEGTPSELALEPEMFGDVGIFSYEENDRYIGIVTNCGYQVDITDPDIHFLLMCFIAIRACEGEKSSGDTLLDSYYDRLEKDAKLMDRDDAMMYV